MHVLALDGRSSGDHVQVTGRRGASEAQTLALFDIAASKTENGVALLKEEVDGVALALVPSLTACGTLV